VAAASAAQLLPVAQVVAATPASVGPAAPAGSTPRTAGAATPVPVYGTELPPPLTLQYTARRGALSGRASLEWRPGPAGYELSLTATVLGVQALSQLSRGTVDAHGLAPQRFLDRRRGRDALAANFRRDAGIVSFSGPEHTFPLLPGIQDRVSWMVQLPAVLKANPALRRPGAELQVFVVGARGDGAVWSFNVLGIEPLAVPGTPALPTLQVQRLPRHEHDTRADVWLDPARHFMPVKVALQSGDGEALVLLLERTEAP
jgi:hypothetical protein